MPAKKKPAKKSKPKTKKKTKSSKKKKVTKKIKEKLIGKVEHIFDRIDVITTTLKNPLKVGDIVHIKGHTTDFIQTINSLQIEHQSVMKAKKGDGIGFKVAGIVRDTDVIYLADKKTIAEHERRLLELKKPAPAAPPQAKFMSF